MSVQYIARISCDSCGFTIDCDPMIESWDEGPAYMQHCHHELSFDPPRDWLGGYVDHAGKLVPLECPACVKLRYG